MSAEALIPVSRRRTAICGLLAAVSVSLLAWGCWPSPRATAELAISQARAAEELFNPQSGSLSGSPRVGDASETASFTVTLDYPTQLRAGDPVRVRMHVRPPAEAGAGSAPSAGEGKLQEALMSQRLVAEARLELPGADVRPREAVNQYISSGWPADFVWSAVLAERTEARGTVWLSLILQDAESEEQARATISAQPMATRGVTMLGLGGPMARVVAALGLLCAAFIGFPLAANAIVQLSSVPDDQSK